MFECDSSDIEQNQGNMVSKFELFATHRKEEGALPERHQGNRRTSL